MKSASIDIYPRLNDVERIMMYTKGDARNNTTLEHGALLEGAKHEVKFGHHQNLQYFMSAKKLNRRQAHWALFYHTSISSHTQTGVDEKADTLSRNQTIKWGRE